MALCRVLATRWLRTGWVRSLSQKAPEVIFEDVPVEDQIEQKRNKSRLNAKHFRIVHHQVLQLTEDEEVVESLQNQRRLYGKYGAVSGISVAKLWPSKEELELEKEWEKVARPNSVQQMITIARKAKQDEEKACWERQEELKRRVAKLEGWKAEVRARILRQQREAEAAKEKKERLIEEVRRIVGYQIDPRDEKFKEALLQKEREEKKAKKAAKKLALQQRLIERLRKEADHPPASSEDSNTDKGQTSGEGNTIAPGSPIV